MHSGKMYETLVLLSYILLIENKNSLYCWPRVSEMNATSARSMLKAMVLVQVWRHVVGIQLTKCATETVVPCENEEPRKTNVNKRAALMVRRVHRQVLSKNSALL